MQIIDRHQFFHIILEFDQVPYTQTQGWLAFTNSEEKNEVLYLVDDITKPQVACFGYTKRIMGKEMLLIEGPCFKHEEYKSSLIKHFFDNIKELNFDIIELQSYSKYHFEFEIGMRRAGFIRPVGMFSIPITNWVHLQERVEYNNNWIRNISKAQGFNLRFIVETTPSQQRVYDFIDFYNKYSDEKGLAQRLDYISFHKMLKTIDFSIGLVFDTNDQLCSAIVFHHQKGNAGVLFAAINKKAKEKAAAFYMYDQLFAHLKNEGYINFDMGKLLPAMHGSDNEYLFKNGVKGERVLYIGEWGWYKKSIYRPLMYIAKRYIQRKTEM